MSTPYDAMYDDLRRGISPEVAADIGHPVPEHLLPVEDPEEALQYQEVEPGQESQEVQRVEKTAKNIGSVICADCLRTIPCSHVGVRRDGSRYTRGS